MPRHAFKMQLFEAQIAEYQRRHEEIWPDLSALLRASGISDYAIFWDAETNILFGVMEVTDLKVLEALPQNPIMQRWWTYMSDIMETNPDHSPVTKVLKEVFYLAGIANSTIAIEGMKVVKHSIVFHNAEIR